MCRARAKDGPNGARAALVVLNSQPALAIEIARLGMRRVFPVLRARQLQDDPGLPSASERIPMSGAPPFRIGTHGAVGLPSPSVAGHHPVPQPERLLHLLQA